MSLIPAYSGFGILTHARPAQKPKKEKMTAAVAPTTTKKQKGQCCLSSTESKKTRNAHVLTTVG